MLLVEEYIQEDIQIHDIIFRECKYDWFKYQEISKFSTLIIFFCSRVFIRVPQ